jgi:hypothetical protein
MWIGASMRVMETWRLERAIERLRHPRPGGKIEAARQFGIDLTLLIENLRLSPAQRAMEMESVIEAADRVRGAGRRARG